MSTRHKALSVASGLQAGRGIEGVYLAGGRPTRQGGRAWARDLVLWISDMEYNPWLEVLFIENSKQDKNMLMIQLATMTGGNRSKLDIQKESTKQMIEWTFLKIEISKQNAEWKRLKNYLDIFTILSFVLLILF